MSLSTSNIFYLLSDLNDFMLLNPSYFYYKNSLKSYKVVKDYPTFKEEYKKTNLNVGCAEFIREKQPTKMYFDIDYYAEKGDNMMLNNVIEFLIYSIKDIYNIVITENQYTIIEACGVSKSKNCYKHSYHIIINNGVFFSDNKEHKLFIDYLFKSSGDITLSNPKRNELFNKMLFYNPFSKCEENALDNLAYSFKSHALKLIWSRNEGETRYFKPFNDKDDIFENYLIGNYTDEPIEKYFDNTALPTTELWKRDTAYPIQNKHNKNLYSEKLVDVNYTLPIPSIILDKVNNLINKIHSDVVETKRQLINTNPNVWFIEYTKSNEKCLCCKYKHRNNRFYIKIVNTDIYYVCYKTDKQQLLVPNRHTNLYWNEDYEGVDNKPLMKHLPYIDLSKKTTIYLQANMGIGKTVEIKRYLQEEQFIDKKVIFISYRVFLCSEYKKNFGELGFNDYRDLTNNDTDDKYNKVICCFDSLARFQGRKYDIVILDEVDSVLAHASSDLMRARRGISQSIFGFIVSNASLVINADAYLDNERVVSSMKLLRKESTHYAIRNRFIRETNRRVFIYKNYIIQKKNETQNFLNKLINDITENDLKIVVVSMSKKFCLKVQDLLDDKSIKYYAYNSETDDKTKKEHSLDIRGKWRDKDIRCVLYTPTITAGISFQDTSINENGDIDELLDDEKFDSLYCYCGANQRNSCSVDDVKQMLFRVRQLKTGDMNILLNYGLTDKSPIADNVEDIKKMINNNERSVFSTYGEPPSEPLLDNNGFFYYDGSNWKHNLFCCNIARREQSSLYFEPILLDFFDSINIPYEIVKTSKNKDDFEKNKYIKEVSIKADRERLKQLIETENISDDTFKKYEKIKKDHHQHLTEEETTKYLKKYWLKIFNIDTLDNLDKNELTELLTYYYNPDDKSLIHRFRRFKLYITKDIRLIKEKFNNNINKHKNITNDIFDYWDIIDSNDEAILWVDDILKILHKDETYKPIDLLEKQKSIIKIDDIHNSKDEIIKYVSNRFDKMKQILDIREPKKTYTDKKDGKVLGINDWSDRKLKGFLKSFFSITMDYEFKTDSEIKGTKKKATEYHLINKYHTLGKTNTRTFKYKPYNETSLFSD